MVTGDMDEYGRTRVRACGGRPRREAAPIITADPPGRYDVETVW